MDPAPLSALELTEILSKLYADREVKGRVPAGLIANSLRIRKVSEMFGGAPFESIEYLNHPVTYDTRRAVDLLGPLGLAPPPFPEYARDDGRVLQGPRGRPGLHAAPDRPVGHEPAVTRRT